MKKKLICTLLVLALVLCVTPLAFPGSALQAEAHYLDNGYGPYCGLEGCTEQPSKPANNTANDVNDGEKGTAVADDEEEEDPTAGYYERLYVWVARTRDAEGVKCDYVKMELVPVEEDLQAEYLEKYKSFTGWEEDETLRLYSPSRNWLNVQLLGHIAKFETEHHYGGYTVVEIGLIDENFNAASGPVYYEHSAIEADESNPFRLSLRIGEYRIMLPDEYALESFTFAAKPDGNGGWEIILKDSDGNNIDYSVVA